MGWFLMPGEKFTIYMDNKLKKELKKIAIDENKSSSGIISELVQEYILHKKNIKK